MWQTFLTLAAIYFVFMICGALGYRVPREGWRPAGWTPPPETAKHGLITRRDVHLDVAWRTPQFWLLWAVLCLNVTAGIGILGMASPLLQEVFGGRLIGVDAAFTELVAGRSSRRSPRIAAGFTGLLSLFNIAGRIFWASLSDRIGRKATYAVFFLLGFALYASIPWTASIGSLALFVGVLLHHPVDVWRRLCDGARVSRGHVRHEDGGRDSRAAAHRVVRRRESSGRCSSTTSANIQLDHGVPRAQAYSITMYILAALLAVGFICNWLVRPVDPKHHMKAEEGAALAATSLLRGGRRLRPWSTRSPVIVTLAWLARVDPHRVGRMGHARESSAAVSVALRVPRRAATAARASERSVDDRPRDNRACALFTRSMSESGTGTFARRCDAHPDLAAANRR